MILYLVQSLFLGAILVVVARRPRGFNLYQLLLAVVWTFAVILIRYRYGIDQATFYSNDQETQIWLVEKIIRHGISASPTVIIDDRYIVAIPTWLLSNFGIDPLLGFKFLQAICLSFLFKLCSDFLEREQIPHRLWHAIFYAGPLFIFISTIGLRDIEIALAASYFFLGQNRSLKTVSLLSALLLRPHLAVTMVFGALIAIYLHKYKPQKVYFVLIALTIGAFAIGGYGYEIGGFLRYQNSFASPTIFEQQTWWRFFANMLGLQFLTFNELVVKMTINQLIALRLIFVDTFAIPLIFIFTLLNQKLRYSILRTQVFVSFSFFLGLVAQTNFNSSRQNLPFLSTMGVLALIGILRDNNVAPSDSASKSALASP